MDTARDAGKGRADGVSFELARFERTPTGVRVTANGMTRMVDVDLMVVEGRAGRVRLSPIGADPSGPLRAFEIVVDLDVDDTVVVDLVGRGSAESIAVADVPQDMALVCGPDPTAHAPAGPFLHKRGDRLVLTSLTDVVSSGRTRDRTTLVDESAAVDGPPPGDRRPGDDQKMVA